MIMTKNILPDLLSSWEQTYKKGQLTLWIFLALKDGQKYVDEIKEFIEIKSMIFSSLNQEADVYEKIALARHGLVHLQRDLILDDCNAESCSVILTLTERLSFHQQMTIAERNVVVDRLKEWGGETPEELQGQEENVVFSLPKELRLVEISE